MSFLATERKIGLFYFRLCKKKKKEREKEKVVKSCTWWCLHRFAMASSDIDIYFFCAAATLLGLACKTLLWV